MKNVETVKTKLSRLLNGLGRALSLSALLFAGYGLRPAVLSAEVPVKFTYQGNIRQNGFLVTGQRKMVFRIYNSSVPATAVQLWESAEYDVGVSTGVFKVDLEPTTISDWQTGGLWLQLVIEGTPMYPWEELTSAPYAINTLLHSGKRYTTAASSPTATANGDLWYDSVSKVVKFWNGIDWVPTSGSGVPGLHAFTHEGTGSDPIVLLGTHTVAGYITVSSSVTAGWFMGDGSGLNDLNASKITSGSLNGDRIGNVIVSTHIADGTIQNQDVGAGALNKDRLNQSGCNFGELLQWNGAQWGCGSPGAVVEIDPFAILKRDTLQEGATFYVSSGTVNDFNVNNSLNVMGTARLLGAPGELGLSVEATGNVGIGMVGAAARLEVKGVDTQNYSLAVGTGTAHQLVVSTSGAVGIGTENPAAKLDVTGAETSGQYIAVFNSGNKLAAWLRNK